METPAQPTLFDGTPDAPLDARFWAFHRANPHVYERLRTKALQLRRRGWTRYSIKTLYEVLRWEDDIETDDPNSDLKLNNSYTSRYSRLLEEREPELRDFFYKRKLRS